MRDYVFSEAQSRLSTYSFAGLRNLARNWQARKRFAKLHLLDDHQLKDIGLDRDQLRRITGLPLSVDPVWEAERLRLLASRQLDRK